MRVIGTAGHVDHGKSTLVRALTGIDPDRLKEEKTRGMTIDLGFAWMELPGADGAAESVGIVDVPGHIDFIKNMLAGVGSIDAALLVVAADEGVMPQTREHLAILDLLAVPTGLVALTKTDLAESSDWLDLVELDIEELLAATRWAGAPIVRTSAQTGEGLDQLCATLARLLADLPPRRDIGQPRLPVDRIFSLSGFGTVVTGTLRDGAFRVGDEVVILPAGRSARIRGMQTHKQAVERGEPGSRLALNLAGVGTEEVQRGNVVARPESLRPTLMLDASLRLLGDAAKPLAHNAVVDLFIGTAEVAAHVRVLGSERIEPGDAGWIQLRLTRPVIAATGDRFILRRASPSATLGGGVILNPYPGRRWRRFDPATVARLQTLAQGTPAEVALEVLNRAPTMSAAELSSRSGFEPRETAAILDELMRTGAVMGLGNGTETLYFTQGRWGRLLATLTQHIATYHAEYPLRRGIPRGELRSRVQSELGAPATPRMFNALIERAASTGLVHFDDGAVWQAGFAPTLNPGQRQRTDKVVAALAAAGTTPPAEGEIGAILGGDAELMEYLASQGVLVRLGNGVILRREEFAGMVDGVATYLSAHGSITLAEARDHLGTNRKVAQALLEELDARRVTRREGDVRVLRGA